MAYPSLSSYTTDAAPYMESQYYPISWELDKRREFDEICTRYNIQPQYASEMRHIICAPEKVMTIQVQ